MSPACPPQLSAGTVKNPVPSGEKHVVLSLHRKSLVECRQHPARIMKVGLRKRLAADRVERRDRKQGRSHAMAADIEQIHCEVVGIEIVIAKGIAPEGCRWNESPIGLDLPRYLGRRQELTHIMRRSCQVIGEHLLALLEGCKGLVAFHECYIAPRVITYAGQELEPIGQFHDVVVGP